MDTEPTTVEMQLLAEAKRQTKALESMNTVLISLLLLALVFAVGFVIAMSN